MKCIMVDGVAREVCHTFSPDYREYNDYQALLDSRVSQNVPKFKLKTHHVHVAVSIPQEPPIQEF